MYNANHSDLPASSLLDALKFLFNEYRNFNDFKTYSKKPDFEIEEYLKRYEEKVKNLYDINTQILEDDYFYLFLETLKD